MPAAIKPAAGPISMSAKACRLADSFSHHGAGPNAAKGLPATTLAGAGQSFGKGPVRAGRRTASLRYRLARSGKAASHLFWRGLPPSTPLREDAGHEQTTWPTCRAAQWSGCSCEESRTMLHPGMSPSFTARQPRQGLLRTSRSSMARLCANGGVERHSSAPPYTISTLICAEQATLLHPRPSCCPRRVP